MSLKQKVMSGLYWTAGGKLISQTITWVITIIVIRLLDPTDYGLMSLATVLVGILAILNELGLGAAIIQKKDLSENSLKSLFGILLLVNFSFCLVLVLTAPIISNFYNEPRLVKMINVLALQFVFMGFTIIPRSLLLREMAFKKLAYVEFISAITSSLVTLIMAFKGYGVWALVWGTMIMTIISMIGLNIVNPFFHKPQFIIKGMGEFLSLGGYVTLSRVLWYFYTTADILIVGKILSKDLLGFYSVGVMLANLPMQKVSGMINQVAFPAFSSISSNPDAAERHFLKAVRTMSFIAFPILWGIASIAPEIVNIFLGAKWSNASQPLLIIAFIVPIRMISNLISPTALGLGYPEIIFRNSLVAFVVMPIAIYIGTFWGLLGVCLAWVFAFPIVFLGNMYRLVNKLNINLIDVAQAMSKPFLLALFMFGFLQLLKMSNFGGPYDILRMLFFIVCGAVIYGGLTWLINRDGLIEIRMLVRK